MGFQFVNITKKIEKQALSNIIFRKMMLLYYTPIIKREIKLSNVSNQDNLLFIGGGYMPCSAILFSKFSNAKITIIDNDVDALNHSKILLNKMKLDDISVIHCDGMNFDVEEFNIVHVAMQVNPLTEVFDHIYNNLKANSKIIIRVPKDKLKSGYHQNLITIKHTKEIKQFIFSNMKKSYLYVKKI